MNCWFEIRFQNPKAIKIQVKKNTEYHRLKTGKAHGKIESCSHDFAIL
jgi:hypothetical protein